MLKKDYINESALQIILKKNEQYEEKCLIKWCVVDLGKRYHALS